MHRRGVEIIKETFLLAERSVWLSSIILLFAYQMSTHMLCPVSLRQKMRHNLHQQMETW